MIVQYMTNIMGKTFALDRRNQALLLGTEGDDIVQGSSEFPPVWNGKKGVIRLLRGDDIISSRSFVQINGVIDLGRGRDVITGLGENLAAETRSLCRAEVCGSVKIVAWIWEKEMIV
jgi:hypothetical protein